MTPNWPELHALRERIARLTPEERLYLVQEIVGCIRKEFFTDHEAPKRELRAELEAVLAYEAANRAA